MLIDIGKDESFLSKTLSNFAEHHFVIDGVKCASMEGFLQSLKFKDIYRQIEICQLYGKDAKFKGKKKKWYRNQVLYWQGKEIKRDSNEYRFLLDKAFKALSLNNDFKQALSDTGKNKLIHSIGKNDIRRTVLTEKEFILRLYKIRGDRL